MYWALLGTQYSEYMILPKSQSNPKEKELTFSSLNRCYKIKQRSQESCPKPGGRW